MHRVLWTAYGCMCTKVHVPRQEAVRRQIPKFTCLQNTTTEKLCTCILVPFTEPSTKSYTLYSEDHEQNPVCSVRRAICHESWTVYGRTCVPKSYVVSRVRELMVYK